MREGRPLPERIQNAPQLHLGLQLYYDAFFELNTCRTVGMGLGPIPWTAVIDYARAFEFDDEQTDSLIYFVREMDAAFLAQKNKKDGTWPTTASSSPGGWRSGRKA